MRAKRGWGDTQLKLHLERLEELEYLLVHRGGRGQSFVYELLYERRRNQGQPFLPGLIDVEELRRPRLRRQEGGGRRPARGVNAGPKRWHRGEGAASSARPIMTGFRNGITATYPMKSADTGEGRGMRTP